MRAVRVNGQITEVQLLSNWSFISLNKRPYLIRGLNLMILFCRFCGWIRGFRPKTADFEDCGWGSTVKICTVFSQKLHGFFAENHADFLQKTADFLQKTADFIKTVDFGQNLQFSSWKSRFSSRKLWISAENHRFLAENHRFLADFGQKPRIL